MTLKLTICLLNYVIFIIGKSKVIVICGFYYRYIDKLVFTEAKLLIFKTKVKLRYIFCKFAAFKFEDIADV